jgi:tetratricopeptide (TPR) repeat protein
MERLARGLLLCRDGRFADGMRLLDDVLAEQPACAAAHAVRAAALQLQGRAAEAAASYGQALACGGANAVLLRGQGQALLQAGDAAAARMAFAAALDLAPDDADARHGLGRALLATGAAAAAAESFAALVRADPADAAARSGLGDALAALDRPEDAAACYAASLALRPGHADTLCNLGNALQALGRPGPAEDAYRRALQTDAAHVAALTGLGALLTSLLRLDEAEATCRAALAVQPDGWAAQNNLGNALQQMQRYDAAIDAYRCATSVRPDHPDAWSDLGVALAAQGRMAAALAAHARALALAPNSPEIRCNRALALLKAGDLAQGFAENEWRWRLPAMPPHGMTVPQWRGEALQGRTILLHAEQGLGDTLHFVRYAPLVAARGGRVVLRVQPPLVGLLRGMPGVALVLPDCAALPPIDLHCPMLSLPHAFGTTLATIPGAPAYLAADPARLAAWRQRLPRHPGLTVGLVWSGAPRPQEKLAHHVDKRRSLTLAQLAPLAGVPGVRFVSLQKGDAAAQGQVPPAGMTLLDPMPLVADFADTAALVAQLDLVVTVDTSVAHLAGGMGRPVWLLSRYDGCWRWLTGRDDTPWYPTMRLYCQQEPGDWQPAIARLAADLHAAWPRDTPQAAAA